MTYPPGPTGRPDADSGWDPQPTATPAWDAGTPGRPGAADWGGEGGGDRWTDGSGGSGGQPAADWSGAPTVTADATAPDRTPPLPLLFAAAALALAGLVVAALPDVPARALVGAWLGGGVAALTLVVLFIHEDVKRQATGRYLASGLVAPLRTATFVTAVLCVVVAAVRFALLAGRMGGLPL